jgi:Peptidase propeptide and YPEB domain
MKAWYLVISLLLTCAMGCAVLDFDSDDDEQEIPLSEVPAEALQAARGAVDGITLTEAEAEEEDGQMVYEIEGTADGVEYEIEVTADGKVLEVAKEGDDDDEDDDDDDEDDDD